MSDNSFRGLNFKTLCRLTNCIKYAHTDSNQNVCSLNNSSTITASFQLFVSKHTHTLMFRVTPVYYSMLITGLQALMLFHMLIE